MQARNFILSEFSKVLCDLKSQWIDEMWETDPDLGNVTTTKA